MSHPIDSSAPWHATRWPVRSLALASAGALVIGATLSVAPVRGQTGEAGRPIHVLFLGQDEGAMHSSARAFAVAAPRLARHGIQLTHVNTPEQALVPETLAYYDAILIYGDHRTLTNAEENALTTFVSSGKGLVAIHSAAAMFPESARYAALIGGTAADEGAPVPMTVSATTAASPITQGLPAITSVDAPFGRMPAGAAGRTVLMERETATGREPYDVDADRRQGARVRHRARTRRPHVEQRRVPDARRARNRLVGRCGHAGGVPAAENA